jgi:hypothetical protein
MPSYYVAKKNRCPCDASGNCPCMSPFTLHSATSSSLYSNTNSAKVVYKTYTDNVNIINVVGKGEGNARKLGSGGNSYEAYLAKKKGNQYCNCN